MRLSEFKKRDISFYPVLLLECIYPERVRRGVLSFSQYLFYLFLIGIYMLNFGNNFPWLTNLLGLAIIFLTFSIITLMLEAFFLSYYYSGLTAEELDAGRVIYQAKNGDLVSAFLTLPIGQKLAVRLGLSTASLQGYLAGKRGMIDYELPLIGEDKFFTIFDLASALFRQDQGFAKLLLDAGINEKDLLSTLWWIVRDTEYKTDKERWWSRENLSEVKAIGKEFAYGRTFFLDKYSRDLSQDPALFGEDSERSYRDDLVSKIETAFSKSQNANVILVGDPGAGVYGVILDFVRKIVSGRVMAPVAYSRVVDLNWNSLISDSKVKGEFENNLIRCLNETISAGNIVLIIEDLPAFISSALSLGSEVYSLIGQYLEKNVQIIATADPIAYHQKIEQNPSLVQHFEKVMLIEPNEQKTLEVVENFIRAIEHKYKINFTFQGVQELVRSANNYITSGVMPAKAINLILEVSAHAISAGMKIVGKKEVLDFVRTKTNIPVGEIRESEKNILLNLEFELHKRVVGQPEAIVAISNALRRGRAGVRDPKKPIGSFLFLGPTGVGKTETAKALAQIFYNDEKYMMRLDMSEYQTPDSLNRLIGSFEGSRPGILSNMLRENPYGVLLLDEFEKADRDVLNLFLQILDEGFFSDMTGKRVSTQNIILIATSNAASSMIFDITEKGQNPVEMRTEIINKIVSDGIYKPELINRFDDVIIFHPLTKEELAQIATLMLKKLAKRLQEKGIELAINQILVDKVTEAGYNRMFGARPMNRAIQEMVEQVVAKKIISGELTAGSQIEFKAEDFN